MASPYIYSGGLGGSTGDELCSFANVAASGQAWYVHSPTGTNAVSPAGLDRSRPLQTLAQAYTNASAGDIIVFLSGHTQTLSAGQTLNKAGLRLVSEGSGAANMATFTPNLAGVMFDITAAGVVLGNLAFAASAIVTVNPAVVVEAAGVTIRDCRFTPNQNYATTPPLAVSSGGDRCLVRGCTFVGSAAAASAPPYAAIRNTDPISDLTLDDLTIDGGTYGWGTYAIEMAYAVTRLTATNIDLLNDSDLHVVTGSSYTVHVRNKSGSARVVLEA